MKMLVRFQVLGVRDGVTRSLDRAIMAPSLKTARSTISRVGKYLHWPQVHFGHSVQMFVSRLEARGSLPRIME